MKYYNSEKEMPIGEIEKEDGTVHHLCCEGSRRHVLWWSSKGEHCTEPRCEVNARNMELNKRRMSMEGNNHMKTVTRAIYIGDIRFDDCPVFELDEEDGYFKILGDPEFRYPKETVEADKNFIRFSLNENEIRVLNN